MDRAVTYINVLSARSWLWEEFLADEFEHQTVKIILEEVYNAYDGDIILN